MSSRAVTAAETVARPFSDDEGDGGGDEDDDGEDAGDISSSESSDGAVAAAATASTTAASSPGGGGRRPRRGPPRRPNARLLAVHPEDDLLTACAKLRQFGAHDLPVLDTEQNAVVAMLSHRAIMAHLLRRFTDSRRLFDQSLEALRIGSFSSIVVVPASASVISVLGVMAEHGISSVPIVGPDGAVVDVYSRRVAVRLCRLLLGSPSCMPATLTHRDDVGFLANDPSLMCLDAPIGDVRVTQVHAVRPWQ